MGEWNPDEQPLFEVKGLWKRFGAVEALRGADLRIRAGSVTALVGDNGAGKSSLIKSMAGIYSIDTGQMYLKGKPVAIDSPRAAANFGLAFVYQDLALCENLDVVRNMYLGREENRFGFLANHKMEARARETFESLSVTTLRSVHQIVGDLSGGQRQAVAVARAVMAESEIVVLDEPTAALGVAQTEEVLELIERLARGGLGVLVVSHNLSDVMRVADYVTVLRLGRTVAEIPAKESSQQELVELITTGRSERFRGNDDC